MSGYLGPERWSKRVGNVNIQQDIERFARELHVAFGCDGEVNGKACSRDTAVVILYDIIPGSPDLPGGRRNVPIILCDFCSSEEQFASHFGWFQTDPNVTHVRRITPSDFIKGKTGSKLDFLKDLGNFFSFL